MSRDKNELLDHDYDGIQELNNGVPFWLSWMWWISVVFAVLYFLLYHVLGVWDLQEAEFQAEMSEAKAKVEAVASKTAAPEVSIEDMIAKGAVIYEDECSACHGDSGEGDVGPNLTDKYWIFGGSVENISKIVADGSSEEGMPSYKKEIRPADIKAVANYLISLEGSKPEDAKEAEGELFERK